MNAYLIWVTLLGILWITAYYKNQKLRKKIIWSSLIALPFGLGELYFIPNYWTPQTLFNLGMKYHITIEAFFLMYFLGGIAAYTYEGILKKHIKIQKCHPCNCRTPLLVTLISFIALTKLSTLNIVNQASLACLAGGITAIVLYPKLRQHVLYGGIIFALLYWITLGLSDLIVPWIQTTWQMTTLSGITLFKVPIEEIIFGFSFGTIWAPLYEEKCND